MPQFNVTLHMKPSLSDLALAHFASHSLCGSATVRLHTVMCLYTRHELVLEADTISQVHTWIGARMGALEWVTIA